MFNVNDTIFFRCSYNNNWNLIKQGKIIGMNNNVYEIQDLDGITFTDITSENISSVRLELLLRKNVKRKNS